ncbi:hypothetical protein SHKM778_51620 [Streptomyces sp. KM77-8]|uniref:DUF1918 domain-containing protein n=1 Tax=Streptomyces haneummycinicus TaxID=3074435 RepID=A0AAT9HNC1_9ACTN
MVGPSDGVEVRVGGKDSARLPKGLRLDMVDPGSGEVTALEPAAYVAEGVEESGSPTPGHRAGHRHRAAAGRHRPGGPCLRDTAGAVPSEPSAPEPSETEPSAPVPPSAPDTSSPTASPARR